MTVLHVIAYFILAVVITAVYQKCTNARCKSKKRLDGKTCVVTGGTNGMGLLIAEDFAKRGAKVIIACPFEDEGLNAQKLIKDTTGNDKVIFKHLDLGSLKSTREFANYILKTEDRLDLLINNAGMGAIELLTQDGLINVMQVNYYGHFLLTILLLPLLKNSGTSKEKARIVNTSSVHHYIGSYESGNMNKLNYWFWSHPYANSKLCLVLFSYELAKRLKGQNVVVNSVDPGAVGTTITRNNTFGITFGIFIEITFKVVFKTPWEGCQTALHVALDEGLGDVSGEFFKNCKQSRAKAVCYDDKVAKELWEESVQLVKLHESEIDECVR